MSAKHTPGPWMFEADEITAQDGDTIVADLALFSTCVAEEWQANGRLIAAAPELLEMVRYVYDALGTGAPLHNTEKLHMRLCELLGRIDGEVLR